MLNRIDEAAFRAGHRAFLTFVEGKSGGTPFVNFEHPYFVSRELA
jgi:hypothetical protein